MTCTLHDVVETERGVEIYPYRCSHCGECFVCRHRLVGYASWICPDGTRRRTLYDPGVPVSRRRL